MGLLNHLSQKIREQNIDKKIKQAKELMVEEQYPAACGLLQELRHTYYGRNSDRYRYDEVYKLHVECEERSMDQAIKRAKELMAEGKYREAREVLGEYVWLPVYRCDEANTLYDACQRAEAGEPQPVPTPAPKPAPAPKAEPKPVAGSAEKQEPPENGTLMDQYRAFAKKDAAAVYEIGFISYEKKDYEVAADIFRAAAEQGHAGAQCQLAIMYADGKGVAKSNAESIKWLRMSAEQGYAPAQFLLGVFYCHGNSVAQDYAEAAKWYRAAAEQGHSASQVELGVLYYRGDGVAKNTSEAAKWYYAAAEQGEAKAQNNLACMYATGDGVKEDIKEATRWAERAKQTYAREGNRDGVRDAEKLLELFKEYPGSK